MDVVTSFVRIDNFTVLWEGKGSQKFCSWSYESPQLRRTIIKSNINLCRLKYHFIATQHIFVLIMGQSSPGNIMVSEKDFRIKITYKNKILFLVMSNDYTIHK